MDLEPFLVITDESNLYTVTGRKFRGGHGQYRESVDNPTYAPALPPVEPKQSGAQF